MQMRMSNRHWWLMVIQSVAAILFGVLALIWPQPALGAIVIIFGALALLDGAGSFAAAMARRTFDQAWWFGLISGFAGVVVGLMALIWPGLTALALLIMMIAWALVIGVVELVFAFSSALPSPLRFAYGASGLTSVLFGIILLAVGPGYGLLGLIWLIGLYAIVNGVFWGYRAVHAAREYDHSPTGRTVEQQL